MHLFAKVTYIGSGALDVSQTNTFFLVFETFTVADPGSVKRGGGARPTNTVTCYVI